jgi:hypothetical protein
MRDAAAYRPVTSTWRRLPSVPEPVSAGAWAGDQLVVVADGSRAVYALPADGRQWRELGTLPPPPAADNSDLHVLAADDHIVVVGLGAVAVRDLRRDAGGWQEVLPGPGGAGSLSNVRGAVAEPRAIVVLLPDETLRYDLDRGAWSRIGRGLDPDPPQPIPLVRTHGGALVAVDVVNGRIHSLSDEGAWTALAAMDGSRVDASVGVVRDQIVIWGGMGSEQPGTDEGATLRSPE